MGKLGSKLITDARITESLKGEIDLHHRQGRFSEFNKLKQIFSRRFYESVYSKS
jgi:hypothetical protein